MSAPTAYLPLTAAILFSAHSPQPAAALAADIIAIMVLRVVREEEEPAQAAQEVQPPVGKDLPEERPLTTFAVAVAAPELLALDLLAAGAASEFLTQYLEPTLTTAAVVVADANLWALKEMKMSQVAVVDGVLDLAADLLQLQELPIPEVEVEAHLTAVKILVLLADQEL